ncbi:MAG: response regulator [Bacteroidales bacterium]
MNLRETKNNSKPDWREKTVLIVEDDPYSADLLVEALADTGANTIVVLNGEVAVRILKNSDIFDAVLMDIKLPGINGDDATREIRKFNKEIPIIAQTAHAMIHDREKYISAGCTDYFTKPVTIDNLFSILCNYI